MYYQYTTKTRAQYIKIDPHLWEFRGISARFLTQCSNTINLKLFSGIESNAVKRFF